MPDHLKLSRVTTCIFRRHRNGASTKDRERYEMTVIFPEEATAVLEVLIFVTSEPVSTETLSRLTGYSARDIEELLKKLEKLYDQPGHGLQLVKVAGGYQLVTRPEYSFYIEKLLREKATEPELSRAALETLSIIAYYQPVTRAKIEAIRGVRVDHILINLLERGLIKEMGRGSGPGRPILYGSTHKFLEYFGLNDLSDLPPLPDLGNSGNTSEK
jgi:segregation and condensation protein B